MTGAKCWKTFTLDKQANSMKAVVFKLSKEELRENCALLRVAFGACVANVLTRWSRVNPMF